MSILIFAASQGGIPERVLPITHMLEPIENAVWMNGMRAALLFFVLIALGITAAKHRKHAAGSQKTQKRKED